MARRMPKIYWRIIIPQLRPVFLSALVILAHLAIKSYELVVALTGGGPGYATDLPSTFMYAHTFTRNQLGMGAASAVMMLLTVAAIMVPYPVFREVAAFARHRRTDVERPHGSDTGIRRRWRRARASRWSRVRDLRAAAASSRWSICCRWW